MLSKETKLRLVHAVTSEKVADEIEKRLISSTPASTSDSQDILDTLDISARKDISERLFVALAGDNNGAAGKELAKKINEMVAVLQAHANGDEVGAAAETAFFEGQVAGMTTDVRIDADNDGDAGNNILLEQDGVSDIDTLIAAWNLANPSNTATLTSGDGSQIPTEDIQLAGGADAIPFADTDTAPAQAAMGSEPMSDSTFECLVHALTSRKAAEEFKAKYNAMIVAVQAISP